MTDIRLDWNATNTLHYVDQENKMMISQNEEWNPTGNNGKGDSIQGSFEAFYTYGDKRFIEGIQNCWVKHEGALPKKTSKWWIIQKLYNFSHFITKLTPRGKYYYQGYRYPTHYDNDLSRDHTSYTIIAYKCAGYSDKQMKEFVIHIPFRISKKFRFAPDMWLWARVMANIWWAKPLYYFTEIITMSITAIYRAIVFKFFDIEDEYSQNEWEEMIRNGELDTKPEKYTKVWWFNPLPFYAMHIYAWQLHYLKDGVGKEILLSIGRMMCSKHNYVMQILFKFEDRPTREQVYNYKAMRGGRWTTSLTRLNDRGLFVIENHYSKEITTKLLRANVMDVDYLRTLYENDWRFN